MMQGVHGHQPRRVGFAPLPDPKALDLLKDWSVMGRDAWLGKWPHVAAKLGRSFTDSDLLRYLADLAHRETS